MHLCRQLEHLLCKWRRVSSSEVHWVIDFCCLGITLTSCNRSTALLTDGSVATRHARHIVLISIYYYYSLLLVHYCNILVSIRAKKMLIDNLLSLPGTRQQWPATYLVVAMATTSQTGAGRWLAAGDSLDIATATLSTSDRSLWKSMTENVKTIVGHSRYNYWMTGCLDVLSNVRAERASSMLRFGA